MAELDPKALDASPEVKALCELHALLLGARESRHVDYHRIYPFIEKVLDAAIALERAQAALRPAEPEAVPVGVWGHEDDYEGVLHALEIAGMGAPFSDIQGHLYCARQYSPDGYRDAEFRDYGLARAVRIICNNAKRIRSALTHPAPTREGVPTYTTGHCEQHKLPGGCPLHNLQCGWPDCDSRPAPDVRGGE